VRVLKSTHLAAAITALALLAACSGVGPQSVPSPVGLSGTLTTVAGGTIAVRPDRSTSWISPDAKKAKSLLYISDAGTFDVYVYSFPALRLMGKLTGFNRPQGECSDKSGDVWVTNVQSGQILKFRHGESTPVSTITDQFGPVGCAIDPTSGNLAVTNLNSLVLIYKKAAGTPAIYSNPNQHYNYFDGFNRNGDLYVSGETSAYSFSLSVLARGKSMMSTVSVSGGTIYFPGTVQWVGSDLVLGDQKCHDRTSSCLYETSVSGATARVTGTTPLTGSCDVAQALIVGEQLAGGDYHRCGHGKSTTDIWRYPTGGKPTRSVAGVEVPVGAAISNR
jgi:hypothetical protein